jgi:hypothetical protein
VGFYYVQHASLDFNLLTHDDTPFMLELKFQGSLGMMENFEHYSLVSFDVTFNTNQNMVRPFPLFDDAYKKIHSLEHWNYCLQCILCITQLYTP